MSYGFFSLSPLMDCYFYTSANGERAGSRVWLMVSFPSLHWWIATSTLLQMENGQVAVYTLLFFFLVSFDGLLLLHFCKWRMTGSRVCLMVSFPCLHWWIATSTLLQMENVQVAVYDLWFFFIVSINGLLLLHFCKWRMAGSRICLIVFFHRLH